MSKAEHDARVKEYATEIKETLEDGIQEAIQVFLRGCVGSCIHYVGIEGNLDPWLTQFSTHAMDFQSRILARTAEFYDLPMDLRTAAVLQQLDMFLATARMLPATCPLSYPVPTPRSQAMLPPMARSEAERGRSTKPATKSNAGAVGSSTAEPSKPRKPVPTLASKATTASCHAGEVDGSTASGYPDTAFSTTRARPSLSTSGGSTIALRDVPGSYSYMSIISRGFTPSSTEHLPVTEKATKFGVTTPLAITRVAGGRAPVLIQTVAPSTTTVTVIPATLTSTSGSQRPIDCRLLATKCRHNPTHKMAEPTPDIITLDHEPPPIPIVTLDGDDSDPNKLTIDTMQPEEKSPTVVPEKKARVGASPAMAKGVKAAGADIGLEVIKRSQAEAATKAHANKTLGLLSLSSSDGSDLLDPPSTTVMKPQKKRKSKKKRDSAKSRAEVPSSSDDNDGNAEDKEHDSNMEGLCSSLSRSAIIDAIHVKARNADFAFIKLLHQEHGLPSTGMTQDDYSHFLPYIAEYRANHMKDPSLRKKHIWSMDKGH